MREALVIGLSALAAPSAFAAVEWQFNYATSTNHACTTSGACPWTSTRTASNVMAPGQATVTASGLSNTGGLNPVNADPIVNSTIGHLQSAYLPAWGSSGLGVINRDANTVLNNGSASDGGTVDNVEGAAVEHSMDSNQRYDAILFSFSSAVRLTGAKIGWYNTDSDITVLAYTGTNGCTPTAMLTGTGSTACKWGSLSGWTHVGNYADLHTTANYRDVNTGASPLSSNYWIVGTYIPTYGSGWSAANDYVKLVSIYGEAGTTRRIVPEPGSILLLGIAAAGMWGARRMRTQ